MGVTVEVLFGNKSPDTFASLYEQWYAKTVDFCRRTGCGDDDPEDVAQEAFLKAWVAWGDYRATHPFWPWLATIASRSCVDHWRRTVRTVSRDERVSTIRETPVARPDELAEEYAEWELVIQAYDRLKPGDRRVMGLRDIEGWSYNEIADFENVTVDSVRATLHRARAALRDAYTRAIAGSPVMLLLERGRRLWARASVAATRSRRATADPAFVDRAGAAALGTAALVLSIVAPPITDAPNLAERQDPAASSASATDPGPSAWSAGDPTNGAGGSGDVASPALGPSSAGATGEPGRSPRSAAPQDDANAPLVPHLPFDRAEQPESGYLTGFATGDDGTVYAWGSSYIEDCDVVSACDPLFRSTDGGTSWTRIRATGYLGGSVVVPRGTTSRLFAATASEVLHSVDGGMTFRPLIPIGGSIAASPGFGYGDPRLFLAGPTGWEYRDGDAAATPLNFGPPTGPSRSFAFSPDYPAKDDRIFVRSTTRPYAAQPSEERGTVAVCGRDGCGPPFMFDGIMLSPSIAAAPSYRTTGRVVAFNSSSAARLYSSVDGGTTFRPVTLPLTGSITDVVFAPDDAMYVAVGSMAGAGGLFKTTDMGGTWTRLDASMSTALKHGVEAVALLPGGRLLAAPLSHVGGGVLCSTDDGRTWAARCAA